MQTYACQSSKCNSKCVCSACCVLDCNMSSICYKLLKADCVHGFESEMPQEGKQLPCSTACHRFKPGSVFLLLFSISHSCQQLVFLSLPVHVVRTLIIHPPQCEAGSQYHQESLFSSLSPCVPSTSAKIFFTPICTSPSVCTHLPTFWHVSL